MKKLIFFSLLITPMLLTSCFGSESIYQITNYDLVANDDSDKYVQDLSTQELISFLDVGFEFPLYFYSKNCASCETVGEHIANYANQHKVLIYGYDYASNMANYHLLNEYDSELFPSRVVTPRVLLIKDGELALNVHSSKFSSYRKFEKTLSVFLKRSNLYSLTAFDSFEYFTSEFDEFFAFAYKNSNKDSFTLITQLLYEEVSSFGKPILLLDEEKMSQSDIDSFSNYIGVNDLSSYCFYKKDGNLIKTNHSAHFVNLIGALTDFFG